MMRYLVHGVWAAAVTACIVAISYSSSQYYIEKSKQDGIVAKSCVESGGQWVKNFDPSWNCERPK